MTRALGCLAALTLLVALALAPRAGATETAWHSEQPVAAGIDVPAPFGEIGDMAFWAPNRGVLITAGNEALPAGVYAYDGTGWHLYSTVCGGSEGRIAWAGPDEFWTVSDYATAQEGEGGGDEGRGRTLCHFAGGTVVASYAEPLNSADVYQRMKAATCASPTDCWFAGEPLPETAANAGAFHLNWNGSTLTAVPSETEVQPSIEEPPGAVIDLASFAGHFYESASEKPYIREIVPAANPFAPVVLPGEESSGAFRLSTDGSQLWAVAISGESTLRSVGGGFETVPAGELGQVEAVGAEPGTASAWVAGAEEGLATVRSVSAAGAVGPEVTLPQRAEELDPKGAPTKVVCPAPGQCWLSTTEGWLFHLGGPLEQDTDPAMHVLITSRPADGSTRSFVPGGVPIDVSGEVETKHLPGEGLQREPFPHNRRPRSLVTAVKQKVIGKTVLQLSFDLHARAHVQLLAKRHQKVVAKTAKLVLGKGHHRLRLRLDPDHWPTGLDFQVHPAGKSK